MKHIGFTGTRKGMSKDQQFALAIMLPRCYFHHGDCVGADAEAHEIALKIGCKVLIHPPDEPRFRAHCTGYSDRYTPLPYLRRNKDIVECTAQLFVGAESDETQRSGTWSTVRYALKYRMQFDGCYRILLLLRNGGTQEL